MAFFSTRWPRPRAAVALWLLLAGLGGSSLFARENDVFAGPSDLVATMPDRYDVHLQWKNHATAVGGNLVEFQMHPEGSSLPPDERDQFLILGFLDAKADMFRHENLGSETVFTYRIHPYFGHCSAPVGITTGSAAAAEMQPEEPEGPLEEPAKSSGGEGTLKSMRRGDSLADAAPTDLAVVLCHPTHAVIRWRDRAADADGYLVELSRYPDREFQVCAFLPPHATSFRKIALLPDTKIYFRVRAFFYGAPSQTVTKTTGPEAGR